MRSTGNRFVVLHRLHKSPPTGGIPGPRRPVREGGSYKTVNDMLGDPGEGHSVVQGAGDLAIFMVQNDLTPENIVQRGEAMAFPDSVVSYFKGHDGAACLGLPHGSGKGWCLRGAAHHLPPRRGCCLLWTLSSCRHEVEQFP